MEALPRIAEFAPRNLGDCEIGKVPFGLRFRERVSDADVDGSTEDRQSFAREGKSNIRIWCYS